MSPRNEPSNPGGPLPFIPGPHTAHINDSTMPTPKKTTPAKKPAARKTPAKKPAAKPAALDPAAISDAVAESMTGAVAGLIAAALDIAAPAEKPTDMPALMAALAAPFDPADIEWKPQSVTRDKRKGMAVAYVKARAVQDRLDSATGGMWRVEYRPGPAGGVMCGISIRVVMPNGRAEWVTRWDGAENTHIESVKGGFSDAEKRAAVQWGVFRYGYRLPTQWVPLDDRGRFVRRPELPPEYLPQEAKGLTRDDPDRADAEARFHALGSELAGNGKDWDLQRPFLIRAFCDHFGIETGSFSTDGLTTEQIRGLIGVMSTKKRRGQPLIAQRSGTPDPGPDAEPDPDPQADATEDPGAPTYAMDDTLGDIDPADDLPF